MSLPAITVIIPCYKAAATLRRAVESALHGAPNTLQLLLVDDGSPDETGALCDALAAGDPRITALHRPNGGAAAARNTGLAAMQGDWVLFLDADDELLPGLWAALPDALARCPGLVLFGMERTSGPVPCPLAPGGYARLTDLGDALGPLLFETGYLAAPYPKLFSAAVIRAAGLRFDETLAVNEDVRFNLDFLHFSHISPAICCLPGVYYRQHDEIAGSLSRSLRADLLDAEAGNRPALARLLAGAGWPPAGREALLRQSRPADAALWLLESLAAGLVALARAGMQGKEELTLVLAGGVCSNRLICERLARHFDVRSTSHEFAADNACGTALYGALALRGEEFQA